jgi:hypothetical protein
MAGLHDAGSDQRGVGCLREYVQDCDYREEYVVVNKAAKNLMTLRRATRRGVEG